MLAVQLPLRCDPHHHPPASYAHPHSQHPDWAVRMCVIAQSPAGTPGSKARAPPPHRTRTAPAPAPAPHPHRTRTAPAPHPHRTALLARHLQPRGPPLNADRALQKGTVAAREASEFEECGVLLKGVAMEIGRPNLPTNGTLEP